jgi:hypothetical protein
MSCAGVNEFLKPDGKVFFAGEPINELWWKNWGLRLDACSIYCIRKHGWFESGWSEPFLHHMFDRLGWHLTLHKGVGLDGGAVGVAHRKLRQPDTGPHEVAGLEDSTIEAAQSDALTSYSPNIGDVIRERDHARRYPWKYMRAALMERLKSA